MNKESRKEHVPFFLLMYMSPIFAALAVGIWGILVLPHVSLITLLPDVFIILGIYMGALIVYTQNQQRIQRWRIKRAVRREVLNRSMQQTQPASS